MRQGQTRLQKNDQVEVIVGKDKGRVGKILKIDRKANRVVVERINMIKKHMKATDASQPGQIIDREASLHISNIMLVCSECAEKVRIGKKILTDGTKVRVCRNCGATIETKKK